MGLSLEKVGTEVLGTADKVVITKGVDFNQYGWKHKAGC